MASSGVTDAEKKFVEGLIEKKGLEDPIFLKVIVIISAKKEKDKERTAILLLSTCRLLVIKADEKKSSLELDLHYLEIIEVTSSSSSELVIKTREFSIKLLSANESQVVTILKSIHAGFYLHLPGMPEKHLPIFVVKPEERLKNEELSLIANPSGYLESVGPCGGYVRTYKSVCNYLSTPVLEEVCWDIENMLPVNEVVVFDLYELTMRREKLTTLDIKALLFSLKYNMYFKAISIAGCVVPASDVLPLLAQVLETNAAIEKLQLSNVGVTKDTLTLIAKAISTNSALPLQRILLAKSQLDDKGLSVLSSCFSHLKNLVQVDVSKCGGSKSGMTAFLKSLEVCAPTLESLDISNNKLDTESSKALAQLLGLASNLKDLNLANTNVVYAALAANTKKIETLNTLNLSGNSITLKDQVHSKVLSFLSNLPNITELNLSNTNISPEVIPAILANADMLPRMATLDLNDNDLGDTGLVTLTQSLLSRPELRTLKICRNTIKRTKERSKAVSALIRLFEADECMIESLHLDSNPKTALKTDILPFVLSLMTNKRLKDLRVEGNEVGNPLALALGKLVQVNSTIEKLYWDSNQCNSQGYRMFWAGLKRNHSITFMSYPLSDLKEALETEKSSGVTEKMNGLLKKINEQIYLNIQLKTSRPSQSLTSSQSQSSASQYPTASGPAPTVTQPAPTQAPTPSASISPRTSAQMKPLPTPVFRAAQPSTEGQTTQGSSAVEKRSSRPIGGKRMVDTYRAAAFYGEMEKFFTGQQNESSDDKEVEKRMLRLRTDSIATKALAPPNLTRSIETKESSPTAD